MVLKELLEVKIINILETYKEMWEKILEFN